jgi:hypothetical protein
MTTSALLPPGAKTNPQAILDFQVRRMRGHPSVAWSDEAVQAARVS